MTSHLFTRLIVVVVCLSAIGCSSHQRISSPEQDNPVDFVSVETGQNCDVAPRPTFYEFPPYPRLARQAGLEGTAVIRVWISETGGIENASVHQSTGTPTLDNAALHAVESWRFRPGIYHSRAAGLWIHVTIEFNLE